MQGRTNRRPSLTQVACAVLFTLFTGHWLMATLRKPASTASSLTIIFQTATRSRVAIAYDFEMNEPTRGKLALAIQGSVSDEPWKLVHIADVGSIHRLRWGDIDGDTKLDLVVAPILVAGRSRPAMTTRPGSWPFSLKAIQRTRSGVASRSSSIR